jgi:hypothetical protein
VGRIEARHASHIPTPTMPTRRRKDRGRLHKWPCTVMNAPAPPPHAQILPTIPHALPCVAWTNVRSVQPHHAQPAHFFVEQPFSTPTLPQTSIHNTLTLPCTTEILTAPNMLDQFSRIPLPRPRASAPFPPSPTRLGSWARCTTDANCDHVFSTAHSIGPPPATSARKQRSTHHKTSQPQIYAMPTQSTLP